MSLLECMGTFHIKRFLKVCEACQSRQPARWMQRVYNHWMNDGSLLNLFLIHFILWAIMAWVDSRNDENKLFGLMKLKLVSCHNTFAKNSLFSEKMIEMFNFASKCQAS